MIKNTPKYTEQVLKSAVKQCALCAERSYNALGSAEACDNDYEVWERFLSDACSWAELSNDWAAERTRCYGAN